MTSPTERLRLLTRFRNATGLDVGTAIRLLRTRYRPVNEWWCRDCEQLVSDVPAHEAQHHQEKAKGTP